MDTWFLDWIATWHYLAPFGALVVAGFGLPLPEEITLLASGIAVHRERFDFLIVVLICAAGVLIGDSVPFFVGRRFGEAALRSRWVRFALPADRLARIEQRFERHGGAAVFGCRFLTGARLPGYFLAGTLGMGYGRFLALNALGVCITVPLTVWIGWTFADRMQALEDGYAGARLATFTLLGLLTLLLLVRSHRRRRAARAVEPAPIGPEGPSKGPKP